LLVETLSLVVQELILLFGELADEDRYVWLVRGLCIFAVVLEQMVVRCFLQWLLGR